MVANAAPAALSAGVAGPLRAVLVATLAALFLNGFVVGAGIIPSGSMTPTLEPGDRVLVDRLIFAGPGGLGGRWLPVREVAPGDVLWLLSPDGSGRALVKRCAAVAGDRFAGETVAAGRVAVLGDHREDSWDSRAFGTVPRASVGGRVFLVLWSAPPGGSPRFARVARLVR